MKHFTYLIIILLVSLPTFANADYPERLEKIQNNQDKLQTALKCGRLLLQANTAGFGQQNGQSLLKNAAATMKLDSIVTDTMGQSGTWHKEWKEEFLYDAALKNTVAESKEWNAGTGNWFTYDRMEMEYDSQGRLSSILMFARDEPEEDLSLMSKTEAAYDASGRLESIMHYVPGESDEWDLEMKQLYDYDSSDRVSESGIWTLEEGEMVKTILTEHAYDASGNMENIKTYILMEGMEVLFSETKMTYDASNRLTVEEQYDLNQMTFNLEKSSRITTAYNAAGDVSTEIYAYWDAGSQSWIDEEKDEFTYGSTSFADVVFPSYYSIYLMTEASSPDDLNHVIEGINSFEMIGDQWKQTEKSSYYYSSANPSNADPAKSGEFSVFPNPASAYVQVKLPEKYHQLSLEIFLIDGTKIMGHPVSSGEVVPVSHLNRGVYFFRFIDGQKTVYAGKLIRK